MKKWQNSVSKLLVTILLGANLVNMAPAVILAAEASQDSVTEVSQVAASEQESPTSQKVEPTVSTETAVVDLPTTSSDTQLTSEAKATSQSAAEPVTVPIQLLGVNDFHGAINTKGTAYLEGVSTPDAGRAMNLAAHLDEAQGTFQSSHQNGGTERIQAGDLVGGSPANSALLQDEPTIRIFNRMNFGIGTLGNHEFDEGLDEFKRILAGNAPTPGQFNPIVDNYPHEKSTMEVVIANVTEEDGSAAAGFQPYTIRSYGSGDQAVKVGYIGIITTEFTNLVLKQHHEKYRVLDEATTIVKYAKELREQGVNAIVVVSHLAATSQAGVPAGEAVEVMNKVNAQDPDNSVDVVFAAHNHQYTNGVMKSGLAEANDIRIVQSTSNGKAYIDLQGEIDVETGDFVATPEAKVKPVTAREDANQEIAAIVDDADETIKAVTTAKVGTADEAALKAGKISRDNSDDSESPLGNLITDAQLYMANQAGLVDAAGQPVKADFALTNNGGIRADLAVNQNGDITWGAAQEVQPFGNILQVVQLSGKDLIGALNEQHANGKAHYFLQLSGLKMTYTKDQGTFAVKTVTDNQGNEIKEDQFYNVIINDFLFGGGDGFASFTKGKLLAAMDTDTTTFVDYFVAMEKAGQKIASPKLGRKSLAVDKLIPLQLLGVNDFHGALDMTGTAYLEGVATPKAGLAANLAAHLDDAQGAFKAASGGVTERIQAGDLVGASPASSALLQDEPTIKVFNMMNFSIGTIGNHEFDEGLAEFRRILDGVKPKVGQFNPIVDQYPREKSTMEVVLANVVNKADGDHGQKGEVPYGFKPYTVKTYGEGDKAVKVGYIGIVTSEFPNLVLKKHHEDYQVLDEAATIVKYAKELRDNGVNAIVIVSHLAATSAQEVVAGEVADVMTKVDQLDPDNSVDVVFAAHNHQYTNGVIKGSKSDVRVVQSTSQGKAYIDLQGELDSETQDFVAVPQATVKAVTDREDKNQGIAEVVADAQERIKPVTSAKVGLADSAATAAGLISREVTADSESPLGNLITDAQLFMANQAGLKDAEGKPIQADFALTNNGGIRDDLKINEKGEITWGAAQSVQPFGNILQVVAISGKDLRGALNEQHANGKAHYFLQIAGLKLTYSKENDQFKVVDLTDDQGTPINDTQTYHIIINDFLLGGGDGFASFTKGKLVAAMDTDTDTFIDYFKLMEAQGQQISAPATGRKALAKAGSVTEAELKDASSVNKIMAGDKVMTGTTLVGTTISYSIGKARSLVALPMIAETESFSLAIPTELKAGELVSVLFKNGEVSTTVEVVVEANLQAALEDASKVNPITAGDLAITGETLEGATVTYGQHQVVADGKGAFNLPVTKAFQAGEKVSVEFSKDQVNVVIDVTVKAVALKETPAQGEKTVTKKDKLPQMGAAESLLSTIGMVVVFGGYLFYLRKQQEDDLERLG
ncbi:5'-nucleotidase C-terminal domain-containing protein [Vagococcus sp. BWB3-3]|uniref:5'-nucleotidase C-terminal domain-containing protein n=1 Tax=Vagococcus allomyrinae TaxID=2794353 RepID=A0A940SUB0_9ENTE|nr:5'-nucleotidase C-terminal domain-containing protein [Vagococcus allomyrinae]MBP1040574.1 5'-nucleotidase C-terminal domain-containing protein [Vagococcus allomyrinae]